MSAIVSHGLHDCRHLKLVSVIASFNSDGNIIPLYVRIGTESLKIYNAYQSESTFQLMNFKCEVMDNDTVKPIKLTYHLNDHKWSMPV